MGKNIASQSKKGDGILIVYVIIIYKQLTLFFGHIVAVPFQVQHVNAE
jgi:hypothetical protein